MIARIVLSVALMACLTLACCEAKVTKENYDKVTNGISYSQVQKILGSGKDDSSHAGTSISAPGIGATSKSNDVIYVWEDDNGGKIVIIFQDDKVVQKTKTGLD